MVHTRWTRPNLAHEQALRDFVASVLDSRKSHAFLADFLPFHAEVAFFGMINSLSQTLLKITSPGVPDFYQGSEHWDLRLVDPDNRGPVDFESCMNSLQRTARPAGAKRHTTVRANSRSAGALARRKHQALADPASSGLPRGSSDSLSRRPVPTLAGDREARRLRSLFLAKPQRGFSDRGCASVARALSIAAGMHSIAGILGRHARSSFLTGFASLAQCLDRRTDRWRAFAFGRWHVAQARRNLA